MTREARTVFHFHVARAARERYGFDADLYAASGNVVFMDLHAARVFTARINAARRAAGTAGGASVETLRDGDMNAMGLIDEILHYVVGLYRERVDQRAIARALQAAEARLGAEAVNAVLARFVTDFPPPALAGGAMTVGTYLSSTDAGTPARQIVLEEILLLSLANSNPAFRPFQELFDDAGLAANSGYTALVSSLSEFFRGEPVFGPDNQDLGALLASPMRAAPTSLSGQLEYIRTRWGSLLGDLLLRLLTGIDVLREEEKLRFGPFTPGPPAVAEYAALAAETEAFSADTDWMPRAVMIAKNTLVWLDQLSRAYGREVRRLDQVPEEELDRLAAAGFTALWLIGVWERSPASREIKRRMGNPEAEASAYSLFDYVVAAELGGPGAAEELKRRCARRGIRLASDMVPNHTGVDSRWMIEHPERFLSWPHPWPPFPSYTFNGVNLASTPGMGIRLEDHYWEKTDAAVVFQRIDHATGNARLIYHGNDGTHMPWNDTAQLDFLNPDTREAVIQTILHVARMFPIIRFDAAMTLAKKHYQRLWFPEPDPGGDIPSRAGNGLGRHDFDQAMPREFWREVVDRVAREAPGTLLLAEAFWMLEGFFVRTLGMHRVYNSAFMHMLKAEDNAGYRQTIRNTLEFDPEVLKRFVNFMSNPDEQTAIEQFGDGDKYFGVCTLMATLPGLPMFAHGQLEGLREKYGMEFRRSYWAESPSAGLLERHQREIFPLIRRRHLFAGVEGFLLYDMFTPEGEVNEDVFAYSNKSGDDRALVLYNNRYGAARGWIRTSAAFAVKTGTGKTLVQRTLAEGLGLPNDPSSWAVFREQVSGLQFMRNCRETWEKGMYVELGAYRSHVFLDFSVVQDRDGSRWARLATELSGRGVPDIDSALRTMELRPIRDPFAALLAAGPGAPDPQVIDRLFGELLAAVTRQSPGRIDGDAARAAFKARREMLAPRRAVAGTAAGAEAEAGAAARPAPALPAASAAARAALWPWCILRSLCTPADASDCPAPSWIGEWMLAPLLRDHLLGAGWDERLANQAASLYALALKAEGPSATQWGDIFGTPDAERFLDVHVFDSIRWFKKEALELLLSFLASLAPEKPRGKTPPGGGSERHPALLALAEECRYQWDIFREAVDRESGKAKPGKS